MPTKNNSPNLDQYIPEGRKRYVSYYEGAQMYGLAYTGFVKACKEAGANKKIRKTVMVDLDRFEEYLEEQYKEHGTERVRKDGKQEMKDYQTAKYDIDRLLNIDEEQEQKKEEKQRSR